MVQQANRRITEAGLTDRAQAVMGNRAQLLVQPGSQDLIWCEGAIYFMGVAEALRTWRPLLAAGATVAFTEPVWLTEAPPPEVRSWWLSEYPSMSDDGQIRAEIDLAGYRTVASLALPASAWWDDWTTTDPCRLVWRRCKLACLTIPQQWRWFGPPRSRSTCSSDSQRTTPTSSTSSNRTTDHTAEVLHTAGRRAQLGGGPTASVIAPTGDTALSAAWAGSALILGFMSAQWTPDPRGTRSAGCFGRGRPWDSMGDSLVWRRSLTVE